MCPRVQGSKPHGTGGACGHVPARPRPLHHGNAVCAHALVVEVQLEGAHLALLRPLTHQVRLPEINQVVGLDLLSPALSLLLRRHQRCLHLCWELLGVVRQYEAPPRLRQVCLDAPCVRGAIALLPVFLGLPLRPIRVISRRRLMRGSPLGGLAFALCLPSNNNACAAFASFCRAFAHGPGPPIIAAFAAAGPRVGSAPRVSLATTPGICLAAPTFRGSGGSG